jgi:hypothetical protein
MSQLAKITILKDVDSNRKVVKKGMSIEYMLGNSRSILFSDLDKVAEMFAAKYGTKCDKGSIKMSDIDVEKLR